MDGRSIYNIIKFEVNKNGDNNIVFFNGLNYVLPDIHDLEKMKKALENTISNYEEIKKFVDEENHHIAKYYETENKRFK